MAAEPNEAPQSVVVAGQGLPVDARYPGWLAEALTLARAAGGAGEVPVGALVVSGDGQVVGRGANAREATGDPTAHAEVLAIRQACERAGAWRIPDATLVVTLEPCVMCAGALLAARVRTVVFGAWDPKAGACGSVWDLVRDTRANHWVEVVGGLDPQGCGGVLREFFAARR